MIWLIVFAYLGIGFIVLTTLLYLEWTDRNDAFAQMGILLGWPIILAVSICIFPFLFLMVCADKLSRWLHSLKDR